MMVKEWMIRKSCMVANNFVLISWEVMQQSSSLSRKYTFQRVLQKLRIWVPECDFCIRLNVVALIPSYVYGIKLRIMFIIPFSQDPHRYYLYLLFLELVPLQLMSMASQRFDSYITHTKIF